MRHFLIVFSMTMIYIFVQAQENQRSTITSENISKLAELSQWQGAEEGVNLLAFNPLAFEIVTINGDVGVGRGPIVFVDLSTNEILMELPESDAFAFSIDGELFANIDSDGTINIYETTGFSVIETIDIETNHEPVVNMIISPNKQYIAVGVGGAELVALAQFVFVIIDLDTGEEVFQLERESESITEIYATGIVFSDDSENFFVSTSDGFIEQWEIATQEHQIIGENAAYSSRILVKLYDSNLAYLTEEGFNVIDPNLDTQELSAAISDNPAILVAGIAAHPSQPLLAISYLDLDTRETFLQVWNIETIKLVFETVVGESGDLRVLDITFSPDGRFLATSGSDGLVRLWGIPSEE